MGARLVHCPMPRERRGAGGGVPAACAPTQESSVSPARHRCRAAKKEGRLAPCSNKGGRRHRHLPPAVAPAHHASGTQRQGVGARKGAPSAAPPVAPAAAPARACGHGRARRTAQRPTAARPRPFTSPPGGFRIAPPPPPPPPKLAIMSISGGSFCPASSKMRFRPRACFALAAPKNVYAVPLAPARPVRPMRCT
eukprot:scaffold20_cov361-Prasinococcus_capsulatus_cf.AAC.13